MHDRIALEERVERTLVLPPGDLGWGDTARKAVVLDRVLVVAPVDEPTHHLQRVDDRLFGDGDRAVPDRPVEVVAPAEVRPAPARHLLVERTASERLRDVPLRGKSVRRVVLLLQIRGHLRELFPGEPLGLPVVLVRRVAGLFGPVLSIHHPRDVDISRNCVLIAGFEVLQRVDDGTEELVFHLIDEVRHLVGEVQQVVP
jgi:hypothetical protein